MSWFLLVFDALDFGGQKKPGERAIGEEMEVGEFVHFVQINANWTAFVATRVCSELELIMTQGSKATYAIQGEDDQTDQKAGRLGRWKNHASCPI